MIIIDLMNLGVFGDFVDFLLHCPSNFGCFERLFEISTPLT